MGMKMKTGKKLKGFMCDSHASTAVCMSQDYRSVVEVPRRPDTALLDHVRLINSTNYVRLGEQRGRRSNIPSSVVGRSFPVSCLKKHQEKVAQEADDAITNSLAVSGHHNVFQVVVMRVSIHCQGCAGKVKKH
ncbi:hypothetical protein Salat_0155000 [Sesamum alatum]|uniref:Uncharacterized protein n=1 Tax=Sesamum alatum TaxID=300844 RepID=A0AAE1YYP1_9LAMI|nr:hypothetical protein Salat_0155000 [Sesamum alatum]